MYLAFRYHWWTAVVVIVVHGLPIPGPPCLVVVHMVSYCKAGKAILMTSVSTLQSWCLRGRSPRVPPTKVVVVSFLAKSSNRSFGHRFLSSEAGSRNLKSSHRSCRSVRRTARRSAEDAHSDR